MSTRFAVKLACALAEGETYRDYCPVAKSLQDLVNEGAYDPGGCFDHGPFPGDALRGQPGYVVIDLEDDWHRAQTEVIPTDPHELAIMICAIAASTPEFTESYDPLYAALGANMFDHDRGGYFQAYRAWSVANDRRCQRDTFNPEVDAEAHAALVCEAARP